MKKHASAIKIFLLALIVLWGMTLPINGQEKPKPEAPGFTISRAVVGTGVEDREPVGVADTFPATTEKVYCFLEATEIEKDTEVSLVWFHGETEILKFSLPLQMGPRWRTYAYKNLRGMKGDWKVEIKDASGALVKEVTFKVE
jgi:hypothetical protein